MAGPYDIPFNRAYAVGEELTYVREALKAGKIAGDGPFTAKCSALLEKVLGAARVLLTTSCTHALEMSALLLEIGPGDEVIVPSFTFVSSINAFVLRGAIPRFADVRRDTLNLDERLLEGAISPRTKAVVPVHYAGVGCEMEAILAIVRRHAVEVVEDNAHGLFAKFRGKPLGTFGDLATQSFHETKNFSSGEGGALVINNPNFVERAEILREKGTNRSRFFRGQVDKYTWVDVGSSYLPADLLAAVLYAQLEKRDAIQARRKVIWDYYDEHLRGWRAENGVAGPTVPAHCDQAYHMYYLLMPSLEDRQAFIEHLRAKRILAVFHYLPLHLSDMGRRFGGRPGDCPVTEDISDRLVRLPFYNGLTDGELDRVVSAVRSYRAARRAASGG
jgi:dTDP-4-amino-4,6-dideoxygalactose transaminase